MDNSAGGYCSRRCRWGSLWRTQGSMPMTTHFLPACVSDGLQPRRRTPYQRRRVGPHAPVAVSAAQRSSIGGPFFINSHRHLSASARTSTIVVQLLRKNSERLTTTDRKGIVLQISKHYVP
ncbi:hypothetical protein BDA96_10G200300 [Sorghum bicolor]|uniref:Uncharacterized protein n=1 Tax=Sorghum bicolor TaxID=4558 RepID=A0A921Q579_SORBI|nr:hypothetical protein BDA96_10G200300 [Sorghum bicolor]